MPPAALLLLGLAASGSNWTFFNDSDIGTQWTRHNPIGQLGGTGSIEACAERCANTSGCAAVSWNGPESHWGKLGKIGCNFKCSSAAGAVWKGSVPGESLAILAADADLCDEPAPPPPPPTPPPPPPPPLGPPPPRRVRWYANPCCERLWRHDIQPVRPRYSLDSIPRRLANQKSIQGGALDPIAAKKLGPVATGVYTSGWPPAFSYFHNKTTGETTIGTGRTSPIKESCPGPDACCTSYSLAYFQNYTATIHALGMDVFAGMDNLDYDYFPGAPNTTAAQVRNLCSDQNMAARPLAR